jgi:hypothetical protein
VRQTTDVIVLVAASITLITALVPLWKWAWRTHLVRHFDAKRDHYNELIEQAKWYEDPEWARKVEDTTALTEACEKKQEECQNNARQCREFADDVGRKVLFW